MKECKKCNGVFDNDLFYKGHATCKECYKEKVRNHREEKRDHYIEYEKKRSNLPHRVKAREDYAKTEKGIIGIADRRITSGSEVSSEKKVFVHQTKN